MFNVSDEIQELAQAYGEMLAFRHCVKVLERLNQGREIMRDYFILFAWEMIIRDGTTYLLN